MFLTVNHILFRLLKVDVPCLKFTSRVLFLTLSQQSSLPQMLCCKFFFIVFHLKCFNFCCDDNTVIWVLWCICVERSCSVFLTKYLLMFRPLMLISLTWNIFWCWVLNITMETIWLLCIYLLRWCMTQFVCACFHNLCIRFNDYSTLLLSLIFFSFFSIPSVIHDRFSRP